MIRNFINRINSLTIDVRYRIVRFYALLSQSVHADLVILRILC